jgi:hypothetical protein
MVLTRVNWRDTFTNGTNVHMPQVKSIALNECPRTSRSS